MDQEEVKIAKKGAKIIKKSCGGARPGAGRPKGRYETLTVGGLLEQLKKQSGGKNYEELLVSDFINARAENDTLLVYKYHQLILQKVMTTLSKLEITDSPENIEAKKVAFAEALANLAIKTKNK